MEFDPIDPVAVPVESDQLGIVAGWPVGPARGRQRCRRARRGDRARRRGRRTPNRDNASTSAESAVDDIVANEWGRLVSRCTIVRTHVVTVVPWRRSRWVTATSPRPWWVELRGSGLAADHPDGRHLPALSRDGTRCRGGVLRDLVAAAADLRADREHHLHRRAGRPGCDRRASERP